MTTALSVSDLHAGYGDLKVVNGVSFSVEPGSVTAILGRNGAGKTTTLRAIAGLNSVTKGALELGGVDLTTTPAHRRVEQGLAYVQEGKRIFRRRTVEENLVIGAYAVKIDKAELKRRIERAYERFPILRDRRSRLASGLSGGQQQMLAIAQALMTEPDVLLLDEPSGGLAPTIVGDVLTSVGELVQEGLSVVLVEQAVSFALALAEDVVVLDMGQVVYASRSDAPGVEAAIEDAYFARSRSTEG